MNNYSYLTGFLDFSPIFKLQMFAPSLWGINRACFDVLISDDDLYENTESFTILLELDSFTPQHGAVVEPPVTEIFIIDNDGKLLR